MNKRSNTKFLPNEQIKSSADFGQDDFDAEEAMPEDRKTNIVELQVAEGNDARRQRVESDLRRDEALYGIHWTPEQRNMLYQERLQFLEDLDRLHFASVELHRMDLEDRFEQRSVDGFRHRELVATIERGNVVAKAVDFAREHPFLTGLFGASIVKRLVRR